MVVPIPAAAADAMMVVVRRMREAEPDIRADRPDMRASADALTARGCARADRADVRARTGLLRRGSAGKKQCG